MTRLDYSAQTNYTKRKMFLDPAGPVTIQRYDECAYPKIQQYTKAQRGNFWIPDEISLTKDKIDYSKADEATRFIFTSNLLRQTALDSIQGRSPVQIFTPVCSVPEVEAWVQWWSAFEQIHSESYSHIIRNIYQMPTEQFNQIHDTAAIVGMLSNIDKYYHDLHELNCAAETIDTLRKTSSDYDDAIYLLESRITEYEYVKAIYLALIASYGLEAIRFMVSFATSFGMVENKIFIGNGNIISLIAADELLHTSATAYIIQTLVKNDPRFRDIANELRKEASDMWVSVIDEEKAWAHYQFQKGTILGLNEKIMCAQVDWRGQETSRELPSICGIKYDAGVKSTPLPWMNKHLNTNKTQTALQENESVAYVLSSMTAETRFSELPQI